MTSSLTSLHIERHTFYHILVLQKSLFVKLGQQIENKIENLFYKISEIVRELKTSSKPFSDFRKIEISQDQKIFGDSNLPNLILCRSQKM